VVQQGDTSAGQRAGGPSAMKLVSFFKKQAGIRIKFCFKKDYKNKKILTLLGAPRTHGLTSISPGRTRAHPGQDDRRGGCRLAWTLVQRECKVARPI